MIMDNKNKINRSNYNYLKWIYNVRSFQMLGEITEKDDS